MWPWEHLAAGYLLYSLGARLLGREPPSDNGVVVLALATQLPDLVDKPLSWGLGWVPSGHAVGHSIFVAVPVALVAVAAARRLDAPRLGTAFLVGYWSHLATDVVNPLRSGGQVVLSTVLWPFADSEPYETEYGLSRGFVYLDGFLAELSTTDPITVFVLYILVPAGTVVLWVADGTPGTAVFGRIVHGLRRRWS